VEVDKWQRLFTRSAKSYEDDPSLTSAQQKSQQSQETFEQCQQQRLQLHGITKSNLAAAYAQY
jgi:hypothetical protein